MCGFVALAEVALAEIPGVATPSIILVLMGQIVTILLIGILLM
jgi:hypothetical protein